MGAEASGQLPEQFGLPPFELGDRRFEVASSPSKGLGVPTRLGVLAHRHRALGHQCVEVCLVGLVVEDDPLLVEELQLRPSGGETGSHGPKTPLYGASSHVTAPRGGAG